MNKRVGLLLTVLVLVAGSIIANQYFVLQRAHASFENYYAFRGCTQLVDKTDTYGDCTTSDGKTIRIVLISGRWYLEGDGPGIW